MAAVNPRIENGYDRPATSRPEVGRQAVRLDQRNAYLNQYPHTSGRGPPFPLGHLLEGPHSLGVEPFRQAIADGDTHASDHLSDAQGGPLTSALPLVFQAHDLGHEAEARATDQRVGREANQCRSGNTFAASTWRAMPFDTAIAFFTPPPLLPMHTAMPSCQMKGLRLAEGDPCWGTPIRPRRVTPTPPVDAGPASTSAWR